MGYLKLVVVVCSLLLLGCSQDPLSTLDKPKKFFEKNKIGTSSDYGIVKFSDPSDHVITVHGFSDDASSCTEIVNSLNSNACKETGGQGCRNPYSCMRLN